MLNNLWEMRCIKLVSTCVVVYDCYHGGYVRITTIFVILQNYKT